MINNLLLSHLLILLYVIYVSARASLDAFSSKNWQFDIDDEVFSLSAHHNKERKVRFTVALKLRDVEKMHQHFLSVSDPRSDSYGRHLSAKELDKLYGPHPEDKQMVKEYFSRIPGSTVNLKEFGDIMRVTAPVAAIEKYLKTSLGLVRNASGKVKTSSLRAKAPMFIPDHIAEHISFLSLNAPVNNMSPRGVKSEKEIMSERGSNKDEATTLKTPVSVVRGNDEAQILFFAQCSDGSLNSANPPCSDKPAAEQPQQFIFYVTSHANNYNDPYQLDTVPTVISVPASTAYCFNSVTSAPCAGNDNTTCRCVVKLTSLPKYTQLQVNISSSFVSGINAFLGSSTLFALTDVATAAFLSDLYNIPKGIRVNHGSNQSVAEFYEEFYSNPDLETFLMLSGLPNATIPSENVYGDLPNDQSSPGGEAQLDVEYIMALAPGANTFFYSMADYNPYDLPNGTINEGFLAYLELVDSQEYPPLVHSLSYGDIEAEIFNSSNNGSVAYGDRCNQEFMQMGLRGLSVLFSSGDDGIGDSTIRDDQEAACQQANPSWPASSPYVTAVGATQMTNKYLPVCGQPYAVSSSYGGLPITSQLMFECSGTAETVCSSTFGGVITSGGGFSDVSARATTAPWQEAAVSNYLRASNAQAYPPLSYFNASGRGYPDVSTYGSNYFVYLNGQITRESGTSASAPVFAAMVTLWNDIRLAYGQPPMGFIAPFLYYVYEQNPDAFKDVTTGNNACGAGSSIYTVNCCEYSFAASSGWDAATGLGTPDFEIISNLVINSNTPFPNVAAYPQGNSYISDNNDDDNGDKTEVAFGLGAAGVAAGGLALLLAIYMLVTSASRLGNDNTTKLLP